MYSIIFSLPTPRDGTEFLEVGYADLLLSCEKKFRVRHISLCPAQPIQIVIQLLP